MNNQVKKDMIVSLMESFPPAFNHLNLTENKDFINWFMPRLEVLRESDFWSDDEIKEIQTRRLQNLLSYLERVSPFWKQRLVTFNINPKSISILGDLRKLPVTDRELFIKDAGAYAIPRDEKQPTIHTRYTSGTTNTSLAVLMNEPEMSLTVLSCSFRHSHLNLQIIHSILQRKFFLFLGKTVLPHYASLARSFPFDNYAKMSDANIRKEIYRIIRAEPQILWVYPSIASEFAHFLIRDGVSLPLLAVYLHSESSTLKEKIFIKSAFNVPVIQFYASGETGLIGYECPSYFGNGYYHIPRERAIFEVLDENNLPVKKNSEGRLVITILDRKITPILRYANGDRGRFVDVSCSCGNKSPLYEMLGREGEKIKLRGGETFSALLLASNFLELVSPKRIKQYQIQQKSLNEIAIQIIPAIETFDEREIVTIELLLSSIIGNGMTVRVIQVKEITREKSGKIRFFIPLKTA